MYRRGLKVEMGERERERGTTERERERYNRVREKEGKSNGKTMS